MDALGSPPLPAGWSWADEPQAPQQAPASPAANIPLPPRKPAEFGGAPEQAPASSELPAGWKWADEPLPPTSESPLLKNGSSAKPDDWLAAGLQLVQGTPEYQQQQKDADLTARIQKARSALPIFAGEPSSGLGMKAPQGLPAPGAPTPAALGLGGVVPPQGGAPSPTMPNPAAEPLDYSTAITHGLEDFLRTQRNARAAATGGQLEPQPDRPQYAAQTSDLWTPNTFWPKMLYGLAKTPSVPAAGFVGAALGGAIGNIPGAVAGGALLAGGAEGWSTFADALASKMQGAKTQADKDAAWDAAGKEAIKSGAFTAAGWAAFGASPFASTLKNLTLQAVAVQPGISAIERGVGNAQQGAPVQKGALENYPMDVAQNAANLAAFEAAKHAGGAAKGPSPVDEFLRQAEEAQTRQNQAKGQASRAEIDEFLRKQAAGETSANPPAALPAPGQEGPNARQPAPTPTPPPAMDNMGERPSGGPVAEGATVQPAATTKPAQPAEVAGAPSRDAENAALVKDGWTQDDIAIMGQKERATALKDAGFVAPPVEGSRDAPVTVEKPGDIEAARARVDTAPTPAQVEAGNYAKGHVKFDGFDVSIENPKGSVRTGTDQDGKPYQSPPMPADYGYVKRTVDNTNENVDVFLGDKPTGKVFVIDSHRPDGAYDEPKAVLGANSPGDASRIFATSYDKGGVDRIGAITQMTTDQFRDWLKSGAKKGQVVSHEPFEPPVGLSDATPKPAEEPSKTPEPAPKATAEPRPTYIRDLSTEDGELLAKASPADKQHVHILAKKLDTARAANSKMVPKIEKSLADAMGQIRLGTKRNIKQHVEETTAADKARQEATNPPEREPSEAPPLHRAILDLAADENGSTDHLRKLVENGADDRTLFNAAAQSWKDGVRIPGDGYTVEGQGNKVRLKIDGEKLRTLKPKETAQLLREALTPPMSPDEHAAAQAVATDDGARAALDATAAEGHPPVNWKDIEHAPEENRPEPTGERRVEVESEHQGGERPAENGAASEPVKAESAGKPVEEEGIAPKERPSRTLQDFGKEPITGYTEGEENNGRKDAFLRDSAGFLRTVEANLRDGRGFEPHKDKKGKPQKAVLTNPGGPAVEGDVTLTLHHPETGMNVYATVGHGVAGRGTHIMVRSSNKPGDQFATNGTPNEWLAPTKTAKEVADKLAAFAGGEPEAAPQPNPKKQPERQPEALTHPEKVRDFLLNEGRMTKKAAADLSGVDLRDPKALKNFEESVELGVVLAARKIVENHAGDAPATFARLVKLYDDQPKLTARTSTSIQNQAYSTPAPLAFAAAHMADIGREDTVYEPTAGNGMLVITADPAKTVVNELNDVRRAHLEAQGFSKTLDKDATEYREPAGKFDRVIANPPFGNLKAAGGKTRRYDLAEFQPGYETAEIDHVISLKALDAMKDDGRAALILGGLNKLNTEREAGYHKSKAKREFFLHLYDKYNVVDHFTASGDLYAKQGAEWPVDVIIIHGRGKSALPIPAVKAPPILSTWGEIGDRLRNFDHGASVPREGGDEGAPADVGAGERSGDVGEPDAGSAENPAGGGVVAAGNIGEPTGEGPISSGGVRGQRPDREPGGIRSAGGGKGGGKPAGTGARPGAAHKPGLNEPEPENPNEPSFLRAFDKGQRARFEAATDVNKAHALRFGELLDKMRADGTDPERLRKLEHKLNQILDAIMGPAPTAQGATGARGGKRSWTQYSEEQRAARSQARREWEKWRREQRQAEPQAEAAPEQAEAPKQQDTETEGQAPYKSASTRAKGLGTVIPRNMRDATASSLERVKQAHGNLDDYVAKKIGMSPNDIPKHFMGEQVDALALAIDNIDRGGGFIIGDQTGVGKGRVNAAIIRYAIENDRTPVFFTEKPNLYVDAYRDLKDIGIVDHLGREPRILMTNNDQTIPLDDTGTNVLRTGKGHEAALRQAADAGVLPDHDMLFTTYNQMNPINGEETARRALVQALAHKAVFIFDEAHNVGEEKEPLGKKAKGRAPLRAIFLRGIVDQAKGVFYSSATYAKRPNTMDFYRATNMRYAVGDPKALGDAIAKGGVPMQEVVAAMLARDGQYIRRERSFAGIKYATAAAPTDHQQLTDFARGLRAIYQFSEFVQNSIIKGLHKEAVKHGNQVSGGQGAAGAGVRSTAFSSVMHNLIGQMLLSSKAKFTADSVIEALKNGQRPAVALTNTMDSFIKEYMEATDSKVGDAASLSFNDLLKRYLDKTRRYTERKPFSSESTKHYLEDSDLGPMGLAMFNAAKAQLEAINLSNLPISPIDYIRDRIEKAGYTTGEITGRGTRVDYSQPIPVLARRSDSIKERGETIRGFNAGNIHALIFNAAGSTGLSIHDGFGQKWPKGAGQRRMFVVQPNPDINTHLQTLGRMHRTGQATLPEFTQVTSESPAEVRISSILQGKLASLNANTTASKKSHFTSEETPDFLNQYGDEIALQAMADDPELHAMMGSPLDKMKEGEGGHMSVLTGHIAMLDYPDAVKLMGNLVSAYNDHIKTLEETGQNALNTAPMDLDAKYMHGFDVSPKTGPSEFQGAVHLAQYDVKSEKKPIRFDKVFEAMAKTLQMETAAPSAELTNRTMRIVEERGVARNKSMFNAADKAFQEYRRNLLGKTVDPDVIAATDAALQAAREKVMGNAGMMVVGARISLTMPDDSRITGYVTNFVRKGKSANPFAAGDWAVTVAAPGQGMVTIPLSQIGEGKITLSAAPAESHEATADRYDSFKEGLREQRVIATGNLLKAYDYTGNKGRIAHFKTADGKTLQGVILPKEVKSAGDYAKEQGQDAKSGAEVIRAVANGETMKSADGVVEVFSRRDSYRVSVAAAKADGAKYYLNPEVLIETGDFVKQGQRMVFDTHSVTTAERVVTALMKAGARFKVPMEGEPKAREYAAPRGWDSVETTQRASRDEGLKIVGDIIDKVLPPHSVRYDVRDEIKISDPDALRRHGRAESELSGQYAAGLYDPTRKLILSALSDIDRMPTNAYHEAIHAARDIGLFTKTEANALESRVEDARMRRVLHDMGYRNASAMDHEEVLATFGAAVARAKAEGRPPPRGVTASSIEAFNRLDDLLRRIRNGLTGAGFQTVEDVFGRFAAGEMRDRTELGKSRLGSGLRAELPRDMDYFGDKPRAPARLLPEGFSAGAEENFLDLSAPVRDMAAEANGGTTPPSRLDPYKSKRLLPGRTAAAQQDFQKFYVDPLVKKAKAAGVTRQEIALWLYAEHAPERNAAIDKINPNANGMGSGISDAQAERIKDVLTGEGKSGALQLIAGDVARIREFILDKWESSGLMSEDQVKAIRDQYENYVPLQGWDDPDLAPDAARAMRPGGGMAIRGAEIQQALGRKTIPDDPLANIVNMAHRAIDRAEKNKSLQTAWRFFKSLPSDALDGLVKLDRGETVRKIDPKTGLVVSEPDPRYHMKMNTVPLKIGGKNHYMVFDDPKLADALRRIRPDQLPPVLHQMGQVVNFAKSMWTHYNPEFVVRHFFMRYPIEAFFNAGEDGVAAMFRALKKGYPFGEATQAIFSHGGLNEAGRADVSDKLARGVATPKEKLMAYYQEMRDAGGLMNFADFGGVDRVKAKIDAAIATLDKNPGRATLAQLQAMHEAVNHFTSVLDNAQRLAAYAEARDRGASKIDAAMKAREATVDFALKGRFSNWLTLMWPFANTGAQTAARMIRAGKRSVNMRYVIGGAIALGAANALYAYLMGGNDADGKPYIEKIGDWMTRLNIVTPTPFHDAQRRPYFSTIALPYNYAFPFTIGASAVAAAMHAAGVGKQRYGDIAKNLLHSGLEALLPVTQENSLIGKMTPALALPFTHVAMNENFYGGPVHARQEPWNEGVPKHEQGFRHGTGEGWKQIAHAGAHVGLDAYPEDYREVMGYFTSSLTNLAGRTGNAVDAARSGKTPEPTDVPLLHVLTAGGKQFDAADRAEFYREREEAYGAANQMRELTKKARTTGDATAAKQFQAENAKQISAAQIFRSATGRIGALSKEEDQITANRALSDSDRNAKVDAILQREDAIRSIARAQARRLLEAK